MRFVQYERNDKCYIGVELGEKGDIVNLNASDEVFPDDMLRFIQRKDELDEAVQRYI